MFCVLNAEEIDPRYKFGILKAESAERCSSAKEFPFHGGDGTTPLPLSQSLLKCSALCTRTTRLVALVKHNIKSYKKRLHFMNL